MYTDPILLMPGANYVVKLKATKVNRLPAPWTSKCIDKYPSKIAKFVPPNTNYSSQICLNACFNMMTAHKCGCFMATGMEGKCTL